MTHYCHISLAGKELLNFSVVGGWHRMFGLVTVGVLDTSPSAKHTFSEAQALEPAVWLILTQPQLSAVLLSMHISRHVCQRCTHAQLCAKGAKPHESHRMIIQSPSSSWSATGGTADVFPYCFLNEMVPESISRKFACTKRQAQAAQLRQRCVCRTFPNNIYAIKSRPPWRQRRIHDEGLSVSRGHRAA